MSYNKYYSPTTWEDFPSENTAIDAQRLNHLEDGVDELDDRICALDVNKTQVSWNQQLLTGDKIAEISINGVVKNIYAPNVDGASQQAQAAALVSEGHAQGTQGGSAVGPGSQYYHNNAKYYAEQASASFDNKIASEGYALGTENGDPVSSGSIYYHNNAKFYAEEARHFTPEGYQELVDEVEEKIDKSDVDVKSVTTGKFDTITGGLMQSCVVDLEPKQSGSGTPSPSNIRAISGHTSVDVWNDPKYGKPITWNQLVQNGNFASTSNWNYNRGDFSVSGNVGSLKNLTGKNPFIQQYFTITQGHKYLVAITSKTTTANSVLNVSFRSNWDVIASKNQISIGTSYSTQSTILAIPNNATVSTSNVIFEFVNDNYTSSTEFNFKDAQIIDLTQLFGTTIADAIYAMEQTTTGAGVAYFRNLFPKDYYDYNSGEFTCVSAVNGDTYIQTTINLGGTYYGGKLDAVSGVLTLDRKFKEFNGTEAWNASGTNGFAITRTSAGIDDVLVAGTKQTPMDSNMFPNGSNINVWTNGYIGIDMGTIWIGDTNFAQFTDLATFKSFLSNNHLQIVYPLATPITIQLTPTRLETLVGQNDVFAPLVGQTVDKVDYKKLFTWDDVKRYVDSKIS